MTKTIIGRIIRIRKYFLLFYYYNYNKLLLFYYNSVSLRRIFTRVRRSIISTQKGSCTGMIIKFWIVRKSRKSNRIPPFPVGCSDLSRGTRVKRTNSRINRRGGVGWSKSLGRVFSRTVLEFRNSLVLRWLYPSLPPPPTFYKDIPLAGPAKHPLRTSSFFPFSSIASHPLSPSSPLLSSPSFPHLVNDKFLVCSSFYERNIVMDHVVAEQV